MDGTYDGDSVDTKGHLFFSYKKKSSDLREGTVSYGEQQGAPMLRMSPPRVLSLRPAPLEAGKPGSSASSQLQFLSESPTHRKLPFQTEEPLPASSSVRSQTVGNSSAAYSRICLRTERSRERRSEQRLQWGTWLAGHCTTPARHSSPLPLHPGRPAPSLLALCWTRGLPLWVCEGS